MNGDGSNETKGRPGVSLPEFDSGRPFYISGKLIGIGCVAILPDIKQGMSLCPRTHAKARGASPY